MGKSKQEIVDSGTVIKCTFDDYKLKKTTNGCVISFEIPSEEIDLVKPLLNHAQEPFILWLFRPETTDEISTMMSLKPDDFFKSIGDK